MGVQVPARTEAGKEAKEEDFFPWGSSSLPVSQGFCRSPKHRCQHRLRESLNWIFLLRESRHRSGQHLAASNRLERTKLAWGLNHRRVFLSLSARKARASERKMAAHTPASCLCSRWEERDWQRAKSRYCWVTSL